jgi:hypothetical protein
MDLRPLAHRPSAASGPAGFASLITTVFPALFAEFRGTLFTLLWRGTRNGFGAAAFEFRETCQMRAN